MRKLFLTVLAVSAAGAAGAADFGTYASAKLSLGTGQVSDLQLGVKTRWNPVQKGTDESDSFIGGKIAFGFEIPADSISGTLRAEAEYGYNSKIKITTTNVLYPTEKPDASLTSHTGALNAYYDLNTGSAITPYVGAGFGFACVDGSIDYVGVAAPLAAINGSDSDTLIVWNLSAGARYAIDDAISVDLGYRYSNFGTVEFEGLSNVSPAGAAGKVDASAKLNSHEVMLGLAYKF